MEEENRLQTASTKADLDAERIAEQIMEEQELEKVQDLTHLFNVAQIKKQVVRTLAYNRVLDGITNQMQERIEKRADQFSNKDLLDYAKVMSDNIDKAQKQIQTVDTTPMIQINQQTNIVNVDKGAEEELDRDSKRRVMEAAKAALEFLKNQQAQQITEENSDENLETEEGESVYENEEVPLLIEEQTETEVE